ncbi:MAG: hypothetical protein ACKOTB_14500 [Planctomycetia bacterium]
MATRESPDCVLWLPKRDFQLLLDALSAEHRVVGPRVADGAVVYGDVAKVADLPIGWIDEQDGGHYRLRQAEDAGWFDHVVGPHSLKQFLFPPRETLAAFSRDAQDGGWR